MKQILIGLLMAGAMFADTVFFAKSAGKNGVFHKNETCSARNLGGRHALKSERSEAEAHGLRECKRCYRAKNAVPCTTDSDCESKNAGKGASGWAKENK